MSCCSLWPFARPITITLVQRMLERSCAAALIKGGESRADGKSQSSYAGGSLSKRRGDGSLDDKRKYLALGMRNSLHPVPPGKRLGTRSDILEGVLYPSAEVMGPSTTNANT